MLFLFLLFHAFAAFGLALIAGFARISLPIRIWLFHHWGIFGKYLVELMECPICFGFWEGFFVGALAYPDVIRRWLFMVLLGCFTAATNFTLARLGRLDEEKNAAD